MDKLTLLTAVGEAMKESVEIQLRAIGLNDSNIIKNISYKVLDNGVELLIPDYYKYIESGRRAGLKPPPAAVILKWMQRKGIPQKALYPILRSISNRGIKPRPFLQQALKAAETEIGEVLALDFSTLLDAELKKLLQ